MIGKTGGIVAGILVAGGVLAAITQGGAFWHDYGWVFKSDYREYHAGVVSTTQVEEIGRLLGELKEGQDRNQRQWECDELDEEIPELELQLLDAQTNAEKVALQHKLDKKRERWDKLKCSEFTDLD